MVGNWQRLDAAAACRTQISWPPGQQDVTCHQQEEEMSCREMVFLGAAFYRKKNATGKMIICEPGDLLKVYTETHDCDMNNFTSGRKSEINRGVTTGNQGEFVPFVLVSSTFCCFVYHLSVFAIFWLVRHCFLASLWLDTQTLQEEMNMCVSTSSSSWSVSPFFLFIPLFMLQLFL